MIRCSGEGVFFFLPGFYCYFIEVAGLLLKDPIYQLYISYIVPLDDKDGSFY